MFRVEVCFSCGVSVLGLAFFLFGSLPLGLGFRVESGLRRTKASRT